MVEFNYYSWRDVRFQKLKNPLLNHGIVLMREVLMSSELPRYIVWSTDHLDLKDPFQRRWLLRQILMHGRAQDIRALDLDEISRELDELNLPRDIYSLWNKVLERYHAKQSADQG